MDNCVCDVCHNTHLYCKILLKAVTAFSYLKAKPYYGYY